MLDATGARKRAEGSLDLAEDRRTPGREAHVAGKDKLASGAPGATLDLGDRYEAALAEVAEQETDGGFACEPCGLVAILADAGHIDVGNEKVGIGAAEDDDLDVRVALGMFDQRYEIPNQFGADQVHRRCVDLCKQDAFSTLRLDGFEVHGSNPSLAWFKINPSKAEQQPLKTRSTLS
nr:hypothetical protein [Rhizobium leguminosarum]